MKKYGFGSYEILEIVMGLYYTAKIILFFTGLGLSVAALIFTKARETRRDMVLWAIFVLVILGLIK